MQSFVICFIYISWLTVVDGDLKAPFSIATASRCRGGHYFFPWITPLTLDPYFIMLSVKQVGFKYIFWISGIIQPGIEPQSPRLLPKCWYFVNNLCILQSYVHIKIIIIIIITIIGDLIGGCRVQRGCMYINLTKICVYKVFVIKTV